MFNIEFVRDNESVDEINKEFYGKFSYPWPPISFPYFSKHDLLKFINQDIGDYSHKRLCGNLKIWVAGCGTNQAIFTALKFPKCQILATDVSTQSLQLCQKNAKSMGINNITFLEKSINDVSFVQEFDFVICTGVIHHNANPEYTLSKLRDALKQDGVMELMVYNYYHRLLTVATQKAIRSLSASSKDFDDQFAVTKSLIDNFPLSNLVGDFILQYKNSHVAELADALFQPVEFSYTVDTLNELVNTCDLTIMQPCLKRFDKSKKADNWNMQFADRHLEEKYSSLADHVRWQISNLLMFNDSAPLWFYLQRKDSSFERASESQLCDEFLRRKFKKFSTEVNHFVLQKDGNYLVKDKSESFPAPTRPVNEMAAKVYDLIEPGVTVKKIFQQLNIPDSFYTVNNIRLILTTSEYPYIEAVN